MSFRLSENLEISKWHVQEPLPSRFSMFALLTCCVAPPRPSLAFLIVWSMPMMKSSPQPTLHASRFESGNFKCCNFLGICNDANPLTVGHKGLRAVGVTSRRAALRAGVAPRFGGGTQNAFWAANSGFVGDHCLLLPATPSVGPIILPKRRTTWWSRPMWQGCGCETGSTFRFWSKVFLGRHRESITVVEVIRLHLQARQ